MRLSCIWDTVIICRCFNDVLHKAKLSQHLLWRFPVAWSHKKMIIGAPTDIQLIPKVLEGMEAMRGIKRFIIFSMTVPNLTIMPMLVGLD